MEEHDDKTRDLVILSPGAVIAQYKIVRHLGSGGMAEVYLAEDSRLKRKVALKFLLPQFALDANFKARFMREAQSAAVLNHPNIITIYEVSEYSERVFIAMEYVEGRALNKLIESEKLSTDQLIDLILQICDGLKTAHKSGVVHRDIKPSNIMVDAEGRVRLLDFGLAKAEGDEQLTQTGTAMGTANYMSPEQSQGLEADNRSDIFSLGVLMYEMLTGKLPFRRANMPATLYAIINEDPEPVTKHNPKLTERLQSVIFKALEKKVTERYQKADELISDLRLATNRSMQSSSMSVITSVPEVVPIKSVGVLYLKNLGPEEDDYLSYGITEDLIVDLTRLGSIRVPPMRTILKYKNSEDELETLAEKLNVDIILDGSIMRTQDVLRISAQMINVSTDETLWAERWEQPLSNLPNVKKSLADGLIEAIGLGMTQVRVAGVGVPEAANASAYDNYLKGKYTFDHKHDKSDVEKALSLYQQALTEEPELLAARAGLAEIYYYQGKLSLAQNEIVSALEEAKGNDNKADRANLLRLLAKVHIKHSVWDAAWETAEKAKVISQELKDKDGEAEALSVQISVLQPQSKFDEMLEIFDQILEIARHLEDQERIAEALKNMGVAYSRKGEYDRALALYDEALEISRETDNLSLQAACLANTGNIHLFHGDLDRALAFYKDSLNMSDKLGDTSGSARQTLNMGLVEMQRGEIRKGFEHLKKSVKAFKELEEESYLAMNLANLGEAELLLGKVDEARNDLSLALELGEKLNIPRIIVNANHTLGSSYRITKNFDEAKQHYLKALKIAEDTSLTRNLGGIYYDLAVLSLEENNLNECKSLLRKSEGIAREIGDKLTLCKAAALSGYLTVKTGLFRVGLRTIERQLEIAEKIEDIHLIIHLRYMLGEVLFKSDDHKDKQKGEQLLKETLTLAIDKDYVPEADRIKNILNG